MGSKPSLWARLKARLSGTHTALMKSEEHLAAIARSEVHLHNLALLTARATEQLGVVMGMMARQQQREAMADPRYSDPLRLEPHGFKVHSQYDEDGIIAEVFRRIGEKSRIFIEFGAGDGAENCTGFLLMQGWHGLWIEGNETKLDRIRHMWAPDLAAGRLALAHAFVTVDTIDDIIGKAGFSGEIDLLTVDLDGNDYHVLEKIAAVRPRVICAEYNANIPPQVHWTMARNDSHSWDNVDYRVGVSLKALENLLSSRGYALVGTSFSGVNAFFVDKSLVEGKFAAPFTAENHYNPWRFFYATPYNTLWRGRLT